MIRGLVALFGFAILSAVRDVYARILFKNNKVDPVFLTFLFCAVTLVFFYAVASLGDRKPYSFGELKNRPAVRRYAMALNVATLVAYLTTFMAIKHIDAYSNALVDYGAMPLVTAVLGIFMLREAMSSVSWVAMGLCLLGIGVLTFGATGASQGRIEPMQYAIGLSLAVVSCVAASLNNVWNKRLVREEKVIRAKAIVIRLPLAVVALGVWVLGSWLLSQWGVGTGPRFPVGAGLWLQLLVLSLIGISMPLLLVVYAFERLQLRNLAFALFLVPVFTYVGSVILDSDVTFSWTSAIAGIVVLGGVFVSEAQGAKTSTSPPKAASAKSDVSVEVKPLVTVEKVSKADHGHVMR